MSVLANLTPEQIAAFEGCKSKEELAAKAKELGLEVTEAELNEAMAIISAESGELEDDALDAVAGGASDYNKKGFLKVDEEHTCEIPERYTPLPSDQYRKKKAAYGSCYTCANCREMNGKMVCELQREA